MARNGYQSTNASGLGPEAGRGSFGQAQSGGRATQFTGGTGGVPLSKPVTKWPDVGRNVNGVGIPYTVRTSGGQLALLPERFSAGGTPPQTTGGIQKPIQTMRKQYPPWLAGSHGA